MEKNIKNIQAFLNKFPSDTTSWINATDEIRDLSRSSREYLEEYDGVSVEPVNFDRIHTPAMWNKLGKESILNNYRQMKPDTKARFYDNWGHWFDTYERGGGISDFAKKVRSRYDRINNHTPNEITKSEFVGWVRENIDNFPKKIANDILQVNSFDDIESKLWQYGYLTDMQIYGVENIDDYKDGGSTPQSMQEKHAKLICEKVPEEFKKEFEIIKEDTKDFTDIDAVKDWQDTYNRLYSLLEKKYPSAFVGDVVDYKAGDLISFNIASNRPDKLQGVVEYKDQLGFITVVDGKQYELRKLINIKVLPKPTETNDLSTEDKIRLVNKYQHHSKETGHMEWNDDTPQYVKDIQDEMTDPEKNKFLENISKEADGYGLKSDLTDLKELYKITKDNSLKQDIEDLEMLIIYNKKISL